MEYNKKELDEWAKKSIPILQNFGYLKNEINWIGVIVAFVIGMTLSGILFYGIYYDKFKSSVIQDVNVEPQINITSQTSNSFNFDPKTENDYEHKIYINTTNYINNFLTCP